MTEDDIVASVPDSGAVLAPEEANAETTEEDVSEEYDLELILQSTGHLTHVYPNGMLLGVRTNGVPSARGVHAEVVFVLDLRRAMFGRAAMAMKSSVLEGTNRMIEYILKDIGMDGQLDTSTILTPWGRVRFRVLKSSDGKRRSALHVTRTVYVITKDVKPTMDLSWLTESGRIIDFEEFSMMRRSDQRSLLPDIGERIQTNKWDSLESGIRYGWYGVLTTAFGLVGVVSSLSALITGGTLWIPALAMAAGLLAAAWLMRESRTLITDFRKTVAKEDGALAEVGDSVRIKSAVADSSRVLKTVKGLGLMTSPLLATAADAVQMGDGKSALEMCSRILDECVRVSGALSGNKDEVDNAITGDRGLEKFLSVFRSLDSLANPEEETEIALAYSTINGHIEDPISLDQVVSVICTLTDALYNAGIIQNETADSVYGLINRRATDAYLQEADEDLAQPLEEIPEPIQTQLETSEPEMEFLEAIQDISCEADEPEHIEPVLTATDVDETENEEKTPPVATQPDETPEVVFKEAPADEEDVTSKDILRRIQKGLLQPSTTGREVEEKGHA